MKTALKWAGIGLGALIGLLVIAAVVLYVIGGSRLNRRYDIRVAAVTIPTDKAAIARGRHLAAAMTLCRACHGDNLGGDVIVDEPLLATVYASRT